jgi:vancomycin permeability regulator SanA
MKPAPPTRLRRKPSLARIALYFLAAAATASLGLAGAIAADGLIDRIQPADVAIVPGNRVNPDGQPSSWLKARLDRTLELYRQGLFSHVIVSGGFGKEGFDEGDVMKRYLVEAGIPQAAVLVDHLGDDTYLTARNSAAIMTAHGWKSAIVISQFYQIPRAKLALKRFGVQPIYSAHAQGLTSNGLISLAREIPATIFYFLRPY